jgi:phosphate transport system substrate-binding protein
MVLCAVATGRAERRVALAIGNDRYANLPAGEQLQKAVNDARAVGNALRQIGFEVIPGGENLGRRALVGKLNELVQRLSPGDMAFFFFSGHGLALDGVNYILPADVPDIAVGQETSLKAEALSEQYIISELSGRGVRVAVVVLDACRTNPFSRSGAKGVGGEKGLAPPPQVKGVFSLYAARSGQAARDRLYDGDPSPNSVFSRVLVPALARPGIDLATLAIEVREEVARVAQSAGYDQQPAYYDETIGGRVYLAAATQPAIATPAVPAPPVPAPVAPSPAPAPVVSVLRPVFDAASTRTGDISGAGATFPYPVYAKWGDTYKKMTGVGLNYQSIGSGGGIKQIQAKTVLFGATDVPLSAADLDKSGLVQFPTVMGAIVPIVNVDGAGPSGLVLDGPTLARIFLGQVKSWDDPAIKALNPGLVLPRQAITVVHRADGSGTTFNFTNYLSKVSPEWKAKVGEGTAVEWPVGIGAKGNEGMASNVAQTKGSIGYAEYGYVRQNRLAFSKMVNADGYTVSPAPATIQAAAANADWTSTPGFGLILSNQPGAQSWPMAAASFILIHKQPQDPAGAAELLKFFDWAYTSGNKAAEDLDYVPMPASVVTVIKRMWTREIKDVRGRPLVEFR